MLYIIILNWNKQIYGEKTSVSGLNQTEAKGFTAFLEPIGIFFAIMLASCVGFFFELKANKAFDVLNTVNDDTFVKVIREGNICQITKKEVVVGDIVVLETGEEVPADGHLLEAIFTAQ